MQQGRFSVHQKVVLSLAGLSLVSVGFYVVGALQNRSTEFGYLVWNLFLAWLPLAFVVVLLKLMRTRLWSNWLPVVVTLLWLVFLPNSFYVISDFIHLQDVQRHDLLYDVLMFTSFACSAATIGFTSLYLVHRQLLRRLHARAAHGALAGILFLCSFAIYLGRDLRWNSWDVLINPAGLLFDVSDRIIHPLSSSAMFSTTLSFFVLLGSLYAVGWQIFSPTISQTRQ
jgi:uncharacterized membrane protein